MRHRRIPKTKKNNKLKKVDQYYSSVTGYDYVKTRAEEEHKQKTGADVHVPRSLKKLRFAKRGQKEKMVRVREPREETSRKPWETNAEHLRRTEREAFGAVSEYKLKQKYGMLPDLDISAEITNTRKVIRQENARKRFEYKMKMNPTTAATTASSSQQVKKKKNKRGKKKKELDLMNLHEQIPFGDRVDAPPIMNVRPRKAPTIRRAGHKDLQLKKIFENAQNVPEDPQRVMLDSLHRDKYKRDGTIKCDDANKERQLTEERNRVISAYRSIKRKQKQREQMQLGNDTV